MPANAVIRRYRGWYRTLLNLYPERYHARFGEGMEQTFADVLWERAAEDRSVLGSALWMYVDTSASIIREQVRSTTMDSKIIVRPALVTAGLLLIPYAAMTFGWQLYDPGSGYETLNWSTGDFMAMGILLFGAGLLIELVLRTKGKYRLAAVAAIVLGFLWLWVELAVGLFTTWGS